MDSDYEKKVAEIKSKLISYPNFPKEGILFWDIFSVLSDGGTCKLLQSLLVKVIRAKYPEVDVIVGLESRGFLFAFSLASELGVGCIPIRKKGKLPGEVLSYKYELEYNTDIVEIQKNSVRAGTKCLIVDDLIATGGSLTAAVKLLQQCKANVIGCLVVMELLSLDGRSNLPKGIDVHSLITFD